MKDPAFLFYPKDYYEGTRTMLPEERACYIDLLCYQHQHGSIPSDLRRVMMYCSGATEEVINHVLSEKFQLTDNRWLNRRLTTEIAKREDYSRSKTVTGCLAGLISSRKLDKKTAALLKKDFDYQAFMQISDKKEIKQAVNRWFNRRLTIIANVNANVNVNTDVNKNTDAKNQKFDIEPIGPKKSSVLGGAAADFVDGPRQRAESAIDLFNDICGTSYRVLDFAMVKQIDEVYDAGYGLDDIGAVITLKHLQTQEKDSRGDPLFRPDFLTPNTILKIKNFQKYHEYAKSIHRGEAVTGESKLSRQRREALSLDV